MTSDSTEAIKAIYEIGRAGGLPSDHTLWPIEGAHEVVERERATREGKERKYVGPRPTRRPATRRLESILTELNATRRDGN